MSDKGQPLSGSLIYFALILIYITHDLSSQLYTNRHIPLQTAQSLSNFQGFLSFRKLRITSDVKPYQKLLYNWESPAGTCTVLLPVLLLRLPFCLLPLCLHKSYNLYIITSVVIASPLCISITVLKNWFLQKFHPRLISLSQAPATIIERQ